MNQLDMMFSDEMMTVSEFTQLIKAVLERGVAPTWVRGEISNFRRQSSGHLYFSLKDSGSQLPAVMFRMNASKLDFEIDNGVEVSAYGELSVYEPHGRYQFIVRAMEETGSGRLHREFERLKAKLQKEGLFAPERKKELPGLPLKVGFITSPTGAAIQDFIRILKRRNWPGRLIVIPAKVQGKGASDEIVDAINYANDDLDLDLLVVGRGGGSLEDLWCFNEEEVARALADCSIPTISAVGHEIDVALSDFVADKRAETPSAAAELISSAYLSCLERFKQAARTRTDVYMREVLAKRRSFDLLKSRLANCSPETRIENFHLRLDDLTNRLNAAADAALVQLGHKVAKQEARVSALRPDLTLASLHQSLDSLQVRLQRAFERGTQDKAKSLAAIGARLQVLHPKSTLKRGYAMLRSSDGALLMSKRQLSAGDRVKAELRDGSLWLETLDADTESSA